MQLQLQRPLLVVAAQALAHLSPEFDDYVDDECDDDMDHDYTSDDDKDDDDDDAAAPSPEYDYHGGF